MEFQSKKFLGQLLVEKKIISGDQLNIALKKQEETHELLGAILFKLGFVDEEAVILPIVATQLNVDFVILKNLDIKKEIIGKIPPRFASYYNIMPVEEKEDALVIATSHPLDVHVMDGVSLVVNSKIETVLASEKDILQAIRRYYGVGAETIDQMMGGVKPEEASAFQIENIEEIDSEASIGKFINQILLEAYKDRATDIHIEPFENDLKIRYRIDGVLHDAKVPTNIWRFRDSINSRIKIMSNLNIAERRLPQDGRAKVKVGDADLDLRVSFLPAQFGESVVIRILSSAKLYDMKDLGLSREQLHKLQTTIKQPHGIVFVTGPTGSGKTTTLYACLSKLNQPDKKIITIEDPVEYQIKGITQIQINPLIGLTFAKGLRSMLRHDPDIMMVGEVRDLETADIAVQIALTGHLVFSTLHTNDAPSGITRLIDMGVEPYLISSAVECFIAQRLVRRICPKCKKSKKITPGIISDFGLSPDTQDAAIFEGEGCETCGFTGYYGREGIYEFLFLDEEIRSLITAKASANEVRSRAIAKGMKTLLQHGWEKIQAGITTPSEVIRVTKEENA